MAAVIPACMEREMVLLSEVSPASGMMAAVTLPLPELAPLELLLLTDVTVILEEVAGGVVDVMAGDRRELQQG